MKKRMRQFTTLNLTLIFKYTCTVCTVCVKTQYHLPFERSVQTAFCQKWNGDKKRKSPFIRSVHRCALSFRRSSKLACSRANSWACAWINSSCSGTVVSTPSCDLSNHLAARVAAEGPLARMGSSPNSSAYCKCRPLKLSH